MNAIDFLKQKLGALAFQFPQVQLKYTYNSSIATHIVELTPEKEYYNNEALDDAWIPVSIEFMETFASESIAFVSSDSSLAIEQPEFEWNKPVPEDDALTMNKVFHALLQTKATYELPTTFIYNQREGSNFLILNETIINTHHDSTLQFNSQVTTVAVNKKAPKPLFNIDQINLNEAGTIDNAMAA